MNNAIRNKIVVGVIIFTIIFIAGLLMIDYFTSTKNIVITYKNSHQVEVYDTSGDQEGKNEQHQPLHRLKKSGETVRLNINNSYIVTFKGDRGFESGFIKINLNPKNDKVIINPYFSQEKLSQLLEKESSSINTIIKDKYPSINLYSIQEGRLYHFGEWYGTTLAYVGADTSNADTLRVVLHKKNGVWRVITDPPNISLDKFTYSTVPRDVLSSVNNELEAPIVESEEEPPTEGGARFRAGY